jgi:elongation factor 2
MTKGMEVYLFKEKKKTRIPQIFIAYGQKRELVDEVSCGNILGLVGIRTQVGETITLEEDEPFEDITHIFDPVITKSIEAKSPGDLSKLLEVLRQVNKEDPTVHIEINEETGEHLISGMGELHLEVIENRIKTEKGVDVKTSAPIVVYRETIRGKNAEPSEGKSPNKHNKIYFQVEPLEPEVMEAIKLRSLPNNTRIRKKDEDIIQKFIELGYDTKDARAVRDICEGNIIVDGTRGVIHIGEIIELVLDMFEDVMRRGPVAHEPCFGIKVTILDCKLHEDAIHRGPAQLYPAVREGIRDAIKAARPLIYEPVQTLQFEAPTDYMGELSKLITNKRGMIIDMTQSEYEVMVKGKLPVGEMFGLSSELRSATAGRGMSFVVDQNFEKLPEELQDKIVKQIRSRKGLTDNQ